MQDSIVPANKWLNYSAYLFDMDGTLVNSEPLKGKALAQACEHYGTKVEDKIYQTVMGQNWPTVTQHFFNHAQIAPNLAEFNQIFKEHYQYLLTHQLKETKGSFVLLNHLKEEGKKIAVVSSAAGWMVKQILAQLELDDFFDIIISLEDVTQHKPHPEAYLLALEKLKIEANDTLVFEDSYAGITAGDQAGCDVIAVKHEFNMNNDLSLAKFCISDFSELLRQES